MKQIIKKSSFPEVNPSLIDVHRPLPRFKGGNYTKDNIVALRPIEHMKEHGNYREREEQFEKLKSMMDDREQMLKTKNAMSNRLLASERETDNLDAKTIKFISNTIDEYAKHLKRFESQIHKQLKHMEMNFPIIERMFEIKGVSTISIAQILRYVDIKKARYASSLWAYVGYDKAKHERYTKNEAGGGNKKLRSALYVLADSFIKQRSAYRDIYDREKEKLSVSEKVTKTAITGKKGVHEKKWKDVSAGHRHGAAIRKMMKHFLADLWKVWRTLEGLDTPMLYPEAKLGHKGIVQPEERGWTINDK